MSFIALPPRAGSFRPTDVAPKWRRLWSKPYASYMPFVDPYHLRASKPYVSILNNDLGGRKVGPKGWTGIFTSQAGGLTFSYGVDGSPIDYTNGCTWIVLGQWNAPASGHRIFNWTQSGDSQQIAGFSSLGTTTLRFFVRAFSGGIVDSSFTDGTVLANGNWVLIAGSVRDAADARFWYRAWDMTYPGSSQMSTGASGTGTTGQTDGRADYLDICDWDRNAGQADFDVVYAHTVEGYVEESYIQELTKDPFAFYRSRWDYTPQVVANLGLDPGVYRRIIMKVG